ncbi:MAG TPA: hypothetical protein VGK19_24475 [Capsulimonadaceae bacterium]|jgi:hypothetical protein
MFNMHRYFINLGGIKRLVVVALCLIAILGYFVNRHKDSIPSSKVTTIAVLPLTGDKHKDFVEGGNPERSLVSYMRCNMGDWDTLGSTAVGGNETVYSLLYNRVVLIKPMRASARTVEHKWPLSLCMVKHGANHDLWYLGDDGRDNQILIRGLDDGSQIWALPLLAPLTSQPIPRPVANKKAPAWRELIGDIYSSAIGDVYLFSGGQYIQRISRNGELLNEYKIKTPPTSDKGHFASSAAVSRNGDVYGQQWVIASDADNEYTALLDCWSSKGGYSSRRIDLTGLGRVFQARLVAADDKGALYFEYKYGRHTFDGPSPDAIAMVPPRSNAAHRIFDFGDHYGAQLSAARARTLPTRMSIRRVGDVIGISPTGDLYVDVCDGVNYRVDKISFPPQPPKPWWRVW